MQPTDGNTTQLQSLLDLALAGDESAYGELIERASGRLHSLAKKMLRNYPHLRRWEQTDDVFQNAVLRLHRSISEVRPASVRDFFGLAATQIRRTLIDLARHHFGPQGQHAKHHSDANEISSDNDVGALGVSAEKSGEPETLEAWARFHEAVEELPDVERETFEMVWYANMSQKEIATLLGVSVPTVKRRWRIARLRLADALEDNEPLL